MTDTLPTRAVEAAVLRLFCAECNTPRWSCPHDQLLQLQRHTMSEHHRHPTGLERTPVDTVAHLRVERIVRSAVEQLDYYIGMCPLVIDDTGRRWCLIFTGFGMARDASDPSRWVVGYMTPGFRPLSTIDDPFRVATLELWDRANPTPSTPAPAPARDLIPALIRMKAGL